MSAQEMSRRALIIGLASIPFAWELRRAIFVQSGSAWTDLEDLCSVALELLPKTSAAEIGRAYLAVHRDEFLGYELVRELRSGPHQQLRDRTLFRRELRARVRGTVREDFRQRRMVCVRNWHLALTEARLCALVVTAG